MNCVDNDEGDEFEDDMVECGNESDGDASDSEINPVCEHEEETSGMNIPNPEDRLMISSSPTSDVSSGVAQPPVRPQHQSFPVTKFGSKARSFNHKWYEKYSWLEYSVQKDAIFCYPCRFFHFLVQPELKTL